MRITVLDRRNGQELPADVGTLTDRDVILLNATWVPVFQSRYQRQLRDEDFLMWNKEKSYFDLLIHREGLQSFAVKCDEQIEGVLLLQRQLQPCRSVPGQKVIYVGYLATAPWNRPTHWAQGWHRGVGTHLVRRAQAESVAAGCEGRLGLHALANSEAFYRKQGFREFGRDAAKRGLTYFEYLPAADCTEGGQDVESPIAG